MRPPTFAALGVMPASVLERPYGFLVGRGFPADHRSNEQHGHQSKERKSCHLSLRDPARRGSRRSTWAFACGPAIDAQASSCRQRPFAIHFSRLPDGGSLRQLHLAQECRVAWSSESSSGSNLTWVSPHPAVRKRGSATRMRGPSRRVTHIRRRSGRQSPQHSSQSAPPAPAAIASGP